MTTNKFSHYTLRTTDTATAQAFYTDIFGPQFWGTSLSVVPLPERAAAAGAPAHWVGQIGVSDVNEIVGRIVAEGGQQLGPMQHNVEGSHYAVLRDPFGAVMAVSSNVETPSQAPVAWHLHHSHDHEQSFALYTSLFGWTATEVVEMGPELGSHQMFAWNESGPSVGSMANTARLPHIHTQWLLFFPVANIEDSIANVRAHGGLALEPAQTSSGDILVACDDPQGAAFGMYQAVH